MLIEIMSAAIFIVPIWCMYNKLCFHSWKRTIAYMVFGFYLIAVLALVGFPDIISLKTDDGSVKGIIKINGWDGANFKATETSRKSVFSAGEEVHFPFAF